MNSGILKSVKILHRYNMQTFLPYADFVLSVKALDNKRLGKQRVEAMQILNTLTGKSSGWKNHPAVLMWKNYEDALTHYMNCCINEWISRGFKNTMVIASVDENNIVYPPWFGNEELHASHRSNLLRKDFGFYSKMFNEPNNLPYVWPTKK